MGAQVEVEVFTKFNKISALCDNVKEIARALSFSTVLKLSEDGTKVSRISPYHPRSPEEVDRCTIYVVSTAAFEHFLCFLTSYLIPRKSFPCQLQ